jgi:hypothetical protein
MTTSFLKIIAIGVLIGALAFFAPFIIISFLIIGLIIRLSFRNRFSHGHYGTYKLAFAEKIRSMSEDEYTGFKTKLSSAHCGPHRGMNNNIKQS